MKILYDHQIFEQQRIGGVSRYFSENIFHFPNAVSSEIALLYSDNIYLKNHNRPNVRPIVDYRQKFIRGLEFKGKGRLFSIIKFIYPSKYPDCSQINRQYSIELLKRQNFDVFHPTYYDDYFLKYIGDKPFVLTIHDMNHELYPEFYSGTDELEFVKSKANLANKASHIIAVSENTKKDIIEVLGIKENKISVIYHASSFNERDKKGILDLPEKYLLYVGDRAAAYKNFKFFARALAPILKENGNLFVLCTGREFDKKENDFFFHLGLTGRFISKFVPENLLFEVYNRALTLICPSYYEGFGIPILEAFYSNCPVILTNASCFPEIAEDSALYFEPKSMDSLREQVCKILNNDLTRNNLIQKGQKRVKDFSWEISAQKTLEVYNMVIHK